MLIFQISDFRYCQIVNLTSGVFNMGGDNHLPKSRYEDNNLSCKISLFGFVEMPKQCSIVTAFSMRLYFSN